MEHETISKYDRLRGGLKDVALFTKPSTIKTVQNITGKSETFVVETCRYENEKDAAMGGDYIFIEYLDETGVTRVALPPRVARAIASQRDALTARRRSLTGKRLAQERKARGEVPGFLQPAYLAKHPKRKRKAG